MNAIFIRGNKYLNARYQWSHIPHLFHDWQVGDVLQLTERWKDAPTGFAMVKPGLIDLDKLNVVRL